jgi:hypothetical protein
LFRPYNTGRKVVFLPRNARTADLKELNVNYVIIGGGAQDYYPELYEYIKQSGEYHLVKSQDYTSKLSRGAETWQLYLRNENSNSNTPAVSAHSP